MSFWDPAKRSAYLAKTAEKSEDLRRLRDGDATAEDLEVIWVGLEESEKALIEALLVTDRSSFVAPHDHPALRSLVAKEMLAYPRGQGGNWMRAAKTSYSVPPAVWKKLQHLHQGTKDCDTTDAYGRREAAKRLLKRITNAESWS